MTNQTYSKYGKCNQCGKPINWDKTKREELGTKRPLTYDGLKEHICDPKDKEEFQKSKEQNQQQQAKITADSNGQATVTPVQKIDSATLERWDHLISNYQEQLDNLGSAIIEIKASQQRMEENFSSFMSYNPMSKTLADMVNGILEIVRDMNPNKFAPRSALDLQQEERETSSGYTRGENQN